MARKGPIAQTLALLDSNSKAPAKAAQSKAVRKAIKNKLKKQRQEKAREAARKQVNTVQQTVQQLASLEKASNTKQLMKAVSDTASPLSSSVRMIPDWCMVAGHGHGVQCRHARCMAVLCAPRWCEFSRLAPSTQWPHGVHVIFGTCLAQRATNATAHAGPGHQDQVIKQQQPTQTRHARLERRAMQPQSPASSLAIWRY